MDEAPVQDRSRIWRRVEEALIIASIGSVWLWIFDWKGPWVLAGKIAAPLVLLVIMVVRLARFRRL